MASPAGSLSQIIFESFLQWISITPNNNFLQQYKTQCKMNITQGKYTAAVISNDALN